MGRVGVQRYEAKRAIEIAVPDRVLQRAESGKLQYTQCHRLYTVGRFADSRSNYKHVDYIAANTIRLEVTLVRTYLSLL